jgi:glycosidase
VVHYTTNHDVNSSDGTPVALYGGKDGAMSAFVIASLYKGVPMIYNGQEQGMTAAIPFPFTGVKVQWGAHPDVTRAYRQLLRVRAGSAALRRGTLSLLFSSADVCAFTKTSGTEQALVLVNVRNGSRQFTVPSMVANSGWTNALDGSAYTLGSQVTLPAYGYLVLKK